MAGRPLLHLAYIVRDGTRRPLYGSKRTKGLADPMSANDP